MIRFVVFLVAALFAGLISAAEASAHASLVATHPAEGAVLDAAPAELTLTFNEPVSITSLRLIGMDGSATPLTSTLQGANAVIPVPAGLADGTHVLSWRAISLDGHPVAGSLIFSVGFISGGAVVAPPDTDPAVRTAIWVFRVALYLGLFIGVGGSFFLAWVAPERRPGAATTTVRAFIAAGLVAAPIALGLQGLDVLGEGLPAIYDGPVWNAALATTYGRTIVAALLALAAALVATLLGNRTAARWMSGAGLLGIGLALALSGHASSAPPRPLTPIAVFLHAVSVAFWTGSLIPLAFLLRDRKPEAATALRRFSRAIPFAIIPLLAAGLVLAIVQLRHWSDLWTTDYGRVLSIKLAAVAGLFALAALNRFRFTGRAAALRPAGVAALSRSIRVEIVLVFVVLGTVAFWRYTPPPRSIFAEAAIASAPVETRLQNDVAVADLTVTPGRPGPVEARIAIAGANAAALVPKEVSLQISNPGARIEPISRPATRLENGTWQVADLSIPLPGDWTIRVDILITDFEQTTLEGIVTIPDPAAALIVAGDPAQAADGHDHTHSDLNALNIDVNDPIQVVDAGPTPPGIVMAVDGAADGGLDLAFTLQNFTFAGAGAGNVHVPGLGHAHLYINGSYADEFITSTYHLAPMPVGVYEIDAGLYALDHRAYVDRGKLVSSRTIVLVDPANPIDIDGATVLDVPVGSLPPTEVPTHAAPLGATVVLRLSSDAALGLHLHGYDIEGAVSPASPVTMLFRADIPGRFPVEAHADQEVTIFYLEVRP